MCRSVVTVESSWIQGLNVPANHDDHDVLHIHASGAHHSGLHVRDAHAIGVPAIREPFLPVLASNVHGRNTRLGALHRLVQVVHKLDGVVRTLELAADM